MHFEVRIEVSPREGIANPEGSTIERALPALGFEMTGNGRGGKDLLLQVAHASVDEAQSLVEDIGQQCTTHPVLYAALVDSHAQCDFA